MMFAHTMIRVRDLQATMEFYTQFLGLKESGRKEIGEEATLVFLTDEQGTYELELTHNKDGRSYTPGNQFGHLAFHVEDLEVVIQEVERRGLAFRRSRPELTSRYIFVQDPDGYQIEILEKLKGAAR